MGAIVCGSCLYWVVIVVDCDELMWVCLCLMGDDGELCKHVVAVAFVARVVLLFMVFVVVF